MQVFMITFIIIALAIAGMALGVILSDRRIRGSCGGLNTIKGLEDSCSCEKPCEKRLQREKEAKLNRIHLS
jgi:uncharacterized protein